MAGNAYPHIVFAKDETFLPRTELETLLQELFADDPMPPQTSQDALSVVLRRQLQDAAPYTFTFWYDDEAEGLGERYADYAAPIRRRRVTRCTTMIDFSGDTDESGSQAQAASLIVTTLAQREGVYVFSELDKRFVGMDYEDDLTAAPATSAPPVESVAAPEPAPSPFEPAPAGADIQADTPVEQPVEPAAAAQAPASAESTPIIPPVGPDLSPAEPTSPTAPEAPSAPLEPAVTATPAPSPAPTPTPEPVVVPAQQEQPATAPKPTVEEDEKGKPGLFKRLFGRQGR
ncbi:hypothetical protein [Gephyromycinifex aptenodytis]|uniref:hypothetical protein n=1 Tax=Gephyromycinifex aptenodytis TaxID=2716227 RepID=UPI001445A4E2|nr:hypothetical protein [Gephyromycinifex aptenodytis]